ncbi:hypothetical protein Pla123a_17040 [Posidoniimonas polymericola]|uniref:Ice-binding protein C-terminal domain-containing protein n=1 Tax=Posidoniimonas polymericola TaxID=2528002 RepID=A0A5C5YSH6_9BACT|nr:PEP-CTERM sorting domain-containing protein [Posidoniimonas polymericola]TWT77905.1 hypothetical protein Pla123a_17040 [Posidoniimonas polymericola]
MRRVLFLFSFLVLGAAASAVHADSLALNFAADDPDTATATVTQAAGVLGTENWNNFTGATGSAMDLMSGSGAATSASVEWTSANTWRSGARDQGAGGDAQLMSGYLDYDDDPLTPPVITVSGVDGALGNPAYNVYVYVQGDSDQARGGEWTVNGVTQSLTDSDPFTTFVEGENYLLFTGVTGDVINVTSGGANTFRAPINGIEIVGVPEPGSLALVSLGVLGLGGYVRRR